MNYIHPTLKITTIFDKVKVYDDDLDDDLNLDPNI